MMMQMKKSSFLLLFCFIIGLTLSPPAEAHRVGVPTTTIEWNDRSGKWEVTHQLSAHDFVEVVEPNANLSEMSAGMLNSLMFEYTQSHFQFVGLMLPSYIGAELDGGDIYVYYELWAPDHSALVSNSLLMEAEATRAALLNIKSGASIESFDFAEASSWSTIRLVRPAPAE